MTVRRALAALLALGRKRKLERELDDEIVAHLELAERDALASGMPAEEARMAARRRFGGIQQIKEEHRDRRSLPVIETLLKDLRYGLAALRRDPGFTAVAAGVLALGIGANAAMFSLVNAVLLMPLPFPEPERMVSLWESPKPSVRNSVAAQNFVDWKRQSTVFEALSAASSTSAAIPIAGEPARIAGKLVSAGYFQVFGVKAAIGRTFAPGEDQPGAARVVVLSHAAWEARFGGAPDILNRDLLLDGAPHRVIGILPAGAFDRDTATFWKPLVFTPEQLTRDFHWLQVVGRLRPGVSLEQAQEEMRGISEGLSAANPAWKKGWRAAVEGFGVQLVGSTLRQSIYVGFGAVLMVLLIACANVANLLLAKGSARRKEMSVRAALGASRGRLIAQLLTESVTLCMLGGAAGIAVAYLLIRAALPLLAPSLPFTADVGLDSRVLGFAAAAAFGVSLLAGLVPAMQTSFGELTLGLNQGARGSSGSHGRLRRVIVAGEVAVSLVLICGALLMFRSLLNLQNVNAGVRVANVVTMAVDLPSPSYPSGQKAVQFYDALLPRLQAAAGVERAALASDVPMEGVRDGEVLLVPGKPGALDIRFKRVDPQYFDTLEIPMLAGRAIAGADRAGAPRVAVLNLELARLMAERFGVADPVGRTVRISSSEYGKMEGRLADVQIVGVIRSERAGSLYDPERPVAYVPLAQAPTREIRLIVRTADQAPAVGPVIREALRQLDPHLALGRVSTMEQVKERNLTGTRQPAWLIGSFAMIAVLLAGMGLYGVVAQSVEQQRREIGIRMALGAGQGEVLAHVLRNALAMVGAGLAAGLAGAFALTGLMKSLLFQVSALDPVVFVLACGSMTFVGLLAGLVPATRATRLDPVTVLREDG